MTKQMIEVDVPEGWQVEHVSPPVFNGCAGDEKMAAIEAGLVQIYDPEHNKLIWVMPRKESTNAQTYNDS